jgi:septum formation protein
MKLHASETNSCDKDFLAGLPQPLILGSGSFTRKLILSEMGIDFIVIKRPIDEQEIGDRDNDKPEELVLKLAKAKMKHLVQELSSGRCDEEIRNSSIISENKLLSYVVLTGDQVVTHCGNILEKPLSLEEAKDFVSRYATSPPSTVGSCVIEHIPSGFQVSGVDTATIFFHSNIGSVDVNGKDLVDRLHEVGAPVLDCAGGLMIEHEFVQPYIQRIDGTQDSVMGLSKELVEKLLNELRTKLLTK